MKTYIRFKVVLILCISALFTSCSLDVQESFDFKPDVDLTEPYGNLTAWEYIQTQTAFTEEGEFDNEKLNYMVEAIKKAGYEDIYNQTATTERTYLLLNNGAFRGNGDVIDIVTGDPSTTVTEIINGEEVTRELSAAEVMSRVDTPEEMERLKAVLNYHIVDAYVAQVPQLEIRDERYLFQTLIPGDDGLIAFHRDWQWRVEINRAPAPLPTTATSQWERVRRHNYVFKNGVGHYINDPVRNKPY
ncbi:hypothetical protein BWZ22_11705 [Seonamhaeicola sp. S2-3]|uniref:hypothetical protein n=1 Tax=Seonamhaeicola sp. S2-3 TaxID=1936081 RepID=UPI000972B7BC|nr:hypothetical protein [Seonamhaeicola sp. S2-3]APY11857.1 hypothetical protein BWZ22_11705 [Seonamhaeicola sp. S2-3]